VSRYTCTNSRTNTCKHYKAIIKSSMVWWNQKAHTYYKTQRCILLENNVDYNRLQGMDISNVIHMMMKGLKTSLHPQESKKTISNKSLSLLPTYLQLYSFHYLQKTPISPIIKYIVSPYQEESQKSQRLQIFLKIKTFQGVLPVSQFHWIPEVVVVVHTMRIRIQHWSWDYGFSI